MRWHLLLSVLLVSAFACTASAATEVDTCGQAFSGEGFLAADLDCTGFGGDALVINAAGSLDLRGFTLTGGNLSAVYCSKSCRIVSEPPGGRIVNAALYGVNGDLDSVAPEYSPVRITNVTVSGNALDQVIANGTLTVEDSTIVGTGNLMSNGVVGNRVALVRSTVTNTDFAVFGFQGVSVIESDLSNAIGACVVALNKSAVIRGSTLSDCGTDGVFGFMYRQQVRVLDSTIAGSDGDGIDVPTGTQVKVLRSQISGNAGRGIATGGNRRLIIKDSSIVGNGEGGVYHPSLARIVRTTITGNGGSGVSSCFGSLRIATSTITGNGTNGAVCGVSETCADLSTCEAPVLTDGSVCGTSYESDSGFPGTNWGVCSAD